MKVEVIHVIIVVKCSKVKKDMGITSLNTLGYTDLHANIVIKDLTNNPSL